MPMPNIATSLPCSTSALPCTVFACILLATVFYHTVSLAAGYAELSQLEYEVMQEMNLARQNPKGYARFLEQLRPYYDANLFRPPYGTPVVTAEGIGAVNDAIRFLRTVRSISSFRLSRGMSLGAMDHIRDQGRHGIIGHQGSDGSRAAERVNRYGTWQRRLGENIAYGDDTARQVVMSFIIDDGVADRGHRRTLFNPEYQVVGIACGAHARYRSFCVVTYAQNYKE